MIDTVLECSVLQSTGMLRIGWSSLLRPALRWYRLVGMRAAGSLILPGKAISQYIWTQDNLQDPSVLGPK